MKLKSFVRLKLFEVSLSAFQLKAANRDANSFDAMTDNFFKDEFERDESGIVKGNFIELPAGEIRIIIKPNSLRGLDKAAVENEIMTIMDRVDNILDGFDPWTREFMARGRVGFPKAKEQRGWLADEIAADELLKNMINISDAVV